ncbi:uncharacterized protein LOC122375223 [Amphibalanus amphitrite]|uniref:uncharacterized protein LOC122375223 n=1 Tax=Amphibalanus amphitrite TaxID=1232801 RepID=UPI001C91597C|nr:uncharacterized protein LOC122375223 [Amphibalanus amphitrite]XP_043210428.1 uncharacterized protein LOC122375223 [Amphibalanus amphitrite]
MDSATDESNPLDAAAARAKRVLRENQARADKLKNVLCILQGNQDAAKRALEDAVTRHTEAVSTWKVAFRQVIDVQFVNKAKFLQDQLAVVRRASVGLHTSLERLEALRLNPAAAAAAPAVTDVLERYIAESREVQPDQLLHFTFREVPPDRWARSRLAVGYLQTCSLCPTDLTLEEVAADGLAVTFSAKSERPYDAATVTHMSYSVLNEHGKEVTEVVWVDGHNGCFSATFRAAAPGPHVVSVYLYSVHINGSPMRICVAGSSGSAAVKDSSSQTVDSLGDVADYEGDFVGWMRARLEREISQPSAQALMAVEGGAVARPVCRPQAGSGRLRLPRHTGLDPNNNNNGESADWNAHLFNAEENERSKDKTERDVPNDDDTATRIRAALMRSLDGSAVSGGSGDGPVQSAKREVRRPVAPPPLKKSTVAGAVSSSLQSSARSAAMSASAGLSKPPDVDARPCSVADSTTTSLSADFSRMSIPGEPIDSLRRPVSTAPEASAAPVIQVTVKQNSKSSSPERLVTESNTQKVVEEFRRAFDIPGGSPVGKGEGVVSYGEPGRQWDEDKGLATERDDQGRAKKPQSRSQTPVSKSAGTSEALGSADSVGSGRGERAPPQKQSQVRVTAPRPLRTVRVTSDDLEAVAAAPPNLAQGSVSAKLDLLLRPTPLFKHPIGVAAKGDVLYVADTGNDKVRAFSDSGAELQSPIPSLRRPSALAVLSEDRLAVRFDSGVRVYSVPSEGQVRLLYDLGGGLLKRPFGLAVTSSERLVTVDAIRGKPVVHVFDASPSGEGRPVHSVDISQHVRQPETSKLYFVAASETRFAVTDLGNNVVLLLNWEGRLVARVGEDVGPRARLYDPAGLALDAAGNLLVADSKHHRIVVFASDGTPRGCVSTSHKLNRPSGICLQGARLYVLNYWDNTAHSYKLTVSEQ